MTPAEIVALTAAMFRTSVADIEGRHGTRHIGRARCAAVFVLRECRQSTKLTFGQVGRLVRRPAKSVWYWWLKAQRLRADDRRFRLATDALLAAAVCPLRNGRSSS